MSRTHLQHFGRARRGGGFLGLGLALLMFAVSCDSSSKSGPATATTPAGLATATTPAGPAPTATSSQVDPGSVPLQLDPGAQNAYTIEIPIGWQAENIPAPTGFGRRYTFFEDGARRAQVTVRCESGATVDKLVRADMGIVSTLGGTFASSGMSDVVIGGLTGKETQYTLDPQTTRVLYLQGQVCGWQILLQAYGAGQLPRFSPLFDAILKTFKPLAAG